MASRDAIIDRDVLMKYFLFFVLSLGSFNANADEIKCRFTEPFFSLVIDTDAKTLTRIDPAPLAGGSKVTVLSKNVRVDKIQSHHISPVVEVPRYQVIADGESVMVLELSYQGSDGMSDFAYPYDVKYGSFYGGCDSDKVKRLSFAHE